MPLLDHFQPPLSLRRHWHAFHNAWCTYLAAHLNTLLPEGYFAEPNVQFGIEIDVAAVEEGNGHDWSNLWVPPPPTQVLPVNILSDVVEVQIFAREGGPTLAGAIELVSPANKDRPENREAFISKCATFIQQGIGLMVVDVVTPRAANLHGDLVARVSPGSTTARTALFAASYRLVKESDQPQLELWHQPLELQQPLPILPLWLVENRCLAVDLQATYERTCREQRIS